MRYSTPAFLSLWLLLGHAPVRGQTVSTATGVIAGGVTDATGAVLSGVTVTLDSPALMGTRSTRTNDTGSFRFPALPPGLYTLTLAVDGFSSIRHADIHLTAGFTATVDVTMGLAAFAEEARVNRPAPVVDRHATSIATTFDARQLANLPGSRTMGSVLSASPPCYVSRFDVGGSSTDTGFYGAYGTYGANRPMVEGLSVSGIVPTGFSLDFGAFEEISVGIGAHGPEWHSPGVQMQFLGKSGGNQYRGTISPTSGTSSGRGSTSTTNRSVVAPAAIRRCLRGRPTDNGATTTSTLTSAGTSSATPSGGTPPCAIRRSPHVS